MSYLVIITIVGLAALLMAWMPSISRITRVSYSVFYVLFGAALYLAFGDVLPKPDPIANNSITLHLTELVVIVSLMGTGLKIDQRFSLSNWRVPFRLVSITMIVSIGIVTLLGVYFIGLDLPTAILLGAVLAPTDPVLASDVQVGPPMEDKQDDVKFSLTAEAGMNDGTAFPFTWLALILALGGTDFSNLNEWFWRDFIYRTIAGIALGFIMGRVLAYFVFTLPDSNKAIQVKDGFVAISATLLVYGFTEMLHGYGFIAVFVAAITLRNYEMQHKYVKQLHDFTDQIERLLVCIVLILFGGSLVNGILDALTWPMAIVSLLFLLAVRPAAAWISLSRVGLHHREKKAISFFGIRGMGSFFYLAFALSQFNFTKAAELWAICSFVVLLSVVMHGFTATTIMTRISEEFGDKDLKD